MGSTTRQRFCKSVISFERAWGYSTEDPTNFRGTIVCGPSNDTSRQTLSDWEIMDDDYEGSVDEAGE